MTDTITEIVLAGIKRKVEEGGLHEFETLDRNISLIENGILDSLAYVNLVLELEAETEASVSLADIDPYDHTSINGLIAFFS